MMIQLLVWVTRKLIILFWIQLLRSRFWRNNLGKLAMLYFNKRTVLHVTMWVIFTYLLFEFPQDSHLLCCLWFSITRNFIPLFYTAGCLKLLPWNQIFDFPFINSLWRSKEFGWIFVEAFGKPVGIIIMWVENIAIPLEFLKVVTFSVKIMTKI